jgi:hypothetical protein
VGFQFRWICLTTVVGPQSSGPSSFSHGLSLMGLQQMDVHQKKLGHGVPAQLPLFILSSMGFLIWAFSSVDLVTKRSWATEFWPNIFFSHGLSEMGLHFRWTYIRSNRATDFRPNFLSLFSLAWAFLHGFSVQMDLFTKRSWATELWPNVPSLSLSQSSIRKRRSDMADADRVY